ncbi:MAG: EthD family reductase [Pseudomonadales bacterium]
MIKTYLFLCSSDGGDPFRARGAAAAELLRGTCPQARGYCQTRTLAEQIDASAAPPYAGVAELWFADAAAALDLAGRPEAFAPLLRGGEVIIDAVIVGEERIIMRLPAHHTARFVKGVFPFRRQAALSVEAFQHYWLHRHGPIAAHTQEALAYIQCHPLPSCYEGGAPRYDGITELVWPDVAAARRAMASRQMRDEQVRDAANFAAPGSVLLFLAQEEVIMAA